MVLEELTEHYHVLKELLAKKTADITLACNLIADTINSGNKIFLAGNGGSAADAQHIAAELTGRFVKERKPLPGIALTTDTSALNSNS
jgi:D-sedoheptulose 7-phosphate isomerase